ncbi:MAG: hypothetical protein M1834_005989 [Cirrosporium novae-zelandiae]|nr:MAG: hypothetical protein M1834_005989 [Cirrosporium novae-zelandiae]
MKLSMNFVFFFFTLFLRAFGANSTNYLGSTPAQRHVINLTQAQAIITAAMAQAVITGSPSNIAICDPSGYLVAFAKMDNAFLGSTDISIKKAKTVSLFNGAYTTADLMDLVQPGALFYGIEETNGVLVVFGGGVPVYVNGYFIGSVGVSGGTADQDATVATAGAKAIGTLSL